MIKTFKPQQPNVIRLYEQAKEEVNAQCKMIEQMFLDSGIQPSYNPVENSSYEDILAGKDPVSVVMKGKLLNIALDQFNVDEFMETTFYRDFNYLTEEPHRKPDLSSVIYRQWEITDNGEKIIFKLPSKEMVISNNIPHYTTDLLSTQYTHAGSGFWFNNSPVDFNYYPYKDEVIVSFFQGREITFIPSNLTIAKELDFNLNYLLAQYYQNVYKIYGLVDDLPKDITVLDTHFLSKLEESYTQTKRAFESYCKRLLAYHTQIPHGESFSLNKGTHGEIVSVGTIHNTIKFSRYGLYADILSDRITFGLDYGSIGSLFKVFRKPNDQFLVVERNRRNLLIINYLMVSILENCIIPD